jgi:hypothetical protein
MDNSNSKDRDNHTHILAKHRFHGSLPYRFSLSQPNSRITFPPR